MEQFEGTTQRYSKPIYELKNYFIYTKNNFNLIAATAELLNTTSGELSNVKLDLTNTRIDLAAAKAAAVMKLEEINNELIQVKKDFTIKLEGNFNLTRFKT
jgi:hypothetical protein